MIVNMTFDLDKEKDRLEYDLQKRAYDMYYEIASLRDDIMHEGSGYKKAEELHEQFEEHISSIYQAMNAGDALRDLRFEEYKKRKKGDKK